MFIDSHCHLSDARIYTQAPEMVKRALASGVSRISLGGVEPEEWKRQLELKNKFPAVILTHFGIHPWKIDENFESVKFLEGAFTQLQEMVSQADGVGETGLDFGIKRNPRSFLVQEKYFQMQLQLAARYKKPVVLHIVKSHDKVLQILRIHTPPHMVLHRYSGSAEQMKPFLELGAFISFTGEFAPGAQRDKTKKAFLAVPLERLLIETDAPDQGKEPSEVNDFYRIAAELRGISIENLQQRVADNFAQIY